MQRHQVLTGSANAGNNCYSVGQVAKYTFWAYGSGCDLVISSSKCHPVQVISGQNNILITAIDCADSNGVIAVAYGLDVVIYKPVKTETNSKYSYTWLKESLFMLDPSDSAATVLSWNMDGISLLVGSSVISLWSFNIPENSSSVSFHLDNADHQTDQVAAEWKQVWVSGPHESPIQLDFSPTQFNHYLFASVAEGDCMIKVWYSYIKSNNHVNVLSKPSDSKLDFSFIYLLHPQPVIGFEWRKNLVFDGTEKFANMLISSCFDQICRIWVETKQPVSNIMHFQPLFSGDDKSVRESNSDKFRKTASTPILSDNSEFYSSFNKMGQLVAKHFHIAATINPASDIPLLPSFNMQGLSNPSVHGDKVPVFTVHWLNNKYYQHQVQCNKCVQQSLLTNCSDVATLEESMDENETVDISFVLSKPEINSGNSLTPVMVDNLSKLWRDSRDALFSIHPSDGSLLMWHVDWLDEDRYSLMRQPQVCFSSRIPMVFASGDAATLCPRMILFVNHSNEQNLLHSASSLSFKSDLELDSDKDCIVYSDVKLLSKHSDGSLNLWQISFSDIKRFSSITSISHSLRICGHCFHMSRILSHPVLPLLVTNANHKEFSVKDSSVSELILWRTDPVGPLSYCGGLSELARVSCKEDHLFTRFAWFSLLFPNWCLGADNKSPSTGLIAIYDNKLQIYQAVVDASQILSDMMSPVSGGSYSTRDLISQQSSMHPGCLLHLHTEEDKGKTWGEIVLLETFDLYLLFPSLDSNSTSLFSKFSKKYLVVMVEHHGAESFIHTWEVGFSASIASTKSKRQRKTTVKVFDSSEDESEEEIPCEMPLTFSNVKVDVAKLTTQKLQLSHQIVDACSGVGKFNLFFMADQNEHLHAAPFHLCTLSSNGKVNFWHCNIQENAADKSRSCAWNLWNTAELRSINDDSSSISISVTGVPVLIKAANNTLLACLSLENCETNYNLLLVVVSIFECASSGGSCWKPQDCVSLPLKRSSIDDIKISNLHLDWLSREDGSFFLAVGYDTRIQIYSMAPKDISMAQYCVEKTRQMVKQSSLDVHTRQKLFVSSKSTTSGVRHPKSVQDKEFKWRLLKWAKITELNICHSTNVIGSPKTYCGPVTVSWARDGILVVATETEMHVFSQWLDEEKQHIELTQAINSLFCDNDISVAKGLFEVAAKITPSLHQYHPLILTELLNSGHMAAVREILIHLAICINGDYYDNTCEQVSIHLSKYSFNDQLSHVIQLCTSGNRITPLSLYSLVTTNGKIISSFGKPNFASPKETDKIMDSKNDIDEMLTFDVESDNDAYSSDAELDEILGIKSSRKKVAKASEHMDLSKLEPNYFGKEHCKVINEFLTRNQLPGLNSLHQMELMALADTLNLANSSNLQQPASNEKSSAINLSAGERGYALSGSGAGSLDSCGIRFIMAVHNHLCLLNSLPAANRSVLMKQGLSTCQFAWAFHSETEEEMLSLLPSVQRGSPEWSELRTFGVAWWIRSTPLLRRLVEKLARAAFLKKNDPLDAAVFYLALNKKPVLCGLYRTIKDERMHQFFQRNFMEERWRKAALKNAFALMGKQRFEHAVAFFLLAGSVEDAAEICIEKLNDFQLALLIVRLQDNSGLSQHQLLKRNLLPDEPTGDGSQLAVSRVKADSFVRSMAYWTLGKYNKSLNTLLDHVENEDIADVFNFYIFLRSHPFLLRNKAQTKSTKLGEWRALSSTLEDATEREKHFIFQTALVHLEAGCPLLALECLSMLPRYTKNTEREAKNKLDNIPEPIETKPDVAVEIVDWSRPAATFDDEELELDWSEEEIEEESDDASRPVMNFSIEASAGTPVPKTEPGKTNSVVEEVAEDSNQQDIFAQHLKMTACFQVFVQELKAIANAYIADGGQLRSKLYTWLENASTVLHKVFGWDNDENCSEGLNPVSKKNAAADSSTETEESPSLSSFNAKMSSSQAPSLHELLLADNLDWKTRRDDLARRRKWLLCHHNFLRTLLSYCILHDSAFGILAAVRMELLLLIQESLQEKNSTRSLASPLPMPAGSIPLVTSSIASCKTVVADPLTYLCHMTKDILRAVLDFSSPPHPDNDSYSVKSAMLCSQAAALSTCIYQSLCDTSTPTFRSQLLKADSQSLDGVSSVNHVSSALNSQPPSQSYSAPYVAPSTLPSQWPGVALLQAMLNSDGASENRTKVLILLCEVTVSVYMSLLIHAMHTHSTSLLYRLTNHVLGSKMWNAVFGGGAKIPVKYTKSSSNLKQLASMNVTKLREKLTFKVLSASGDKRGSLSTSSGGHDSLSYREKFIPPEIGLWDWFLTKPFKIPSGDGDVDYDSDLDDDDDADATSDDDDNEDFGGIRNCEIDPNSYSWKLMRVAIIKLVAADLQAFFPLVGFELNELSTNSPFLFAVVRILQEWQTQLHEVLDLCDDVPSHLVQLTSSLPPSRPAMLRFQAILEPTNTPFTASDKTSLGEWRYLCA